MKYRNKRKTPLFWGLIFRAILIVASSAMILSYLSIFINPSKFGFPLFFGLYFIPILFLNLILFCIALIKKSKSIWIPIIVILPSLLFTDLFYKIGGKNVSEKEGIKIKIESYNVGMFYASQKKLDRNECRQNIIYHILEENPDIACLQEFSVESLKQADTLLKIIYPYRFYHLFKVRNNRFFGNITFSKFPIFGTGKISFKESTNLSIYTDINHFGRKIRVYNNHLESYNISFTSLVKRFGNKDMNSEKIKNDIKDVHEKMLGTFIKRSDQVNLILDNIKRSNHPAIICGDFNDTPMSYTYHMLSIGRKDTFKESGKGFGSTFYHLWPLLRIDYILFPKEYESINHKINRQEFSDHYPISAEIII